MCVFPKHAVTSLVSQLPLSCLANKKKKIPISVNCKITKLNSLQKSKFSKSWRRHSILFQETTDKTHGGRVKESREEIMCHTDLLFISRSFAQSLNVTTAKMSTHSMPMSQSPTSSGKGAGWCGHINKANSTNIGHFTRTRIYRHETRAGGGWMRLPAPVGGGVREERKQRSWNKHTLASISWAVEWDGGVKNAFIPSPPHQHTHPLMSLQPSHPINSILARQIKGTNPPTPPPLLPPPNPPPTVGKLHPPNLGWRSLMCCLIVRDTDGGLSLSNLKQIASPWGGDYWTSGDDKAGTVKPSRVWRWREVKLVDSMWAHVFFLCFSFVYSRAASRLSAGRRVSNARTCEWQSTTRAWDQASAHKTINVVFSPLKPSPPTPLLSQIHTCT